MGWPQCNTTLENERRTWHTYTGLGQLNPDLYSSRGACVAWHDLSPFWSHTISALWSDSGPDIMLPDMEARNPLPETLGAETVSLPQIYTLSELSKHSIIRILFMVPIYATVSFLSYTFYWHAIYFEVLRDCYEAFAIASFFALLCHYIAPDLHSQKDYFRTIKPKPWVWPLSWAAKCCDNVWRTPRSGLTWFNVRYGSSAVHFACSDSFADNPFWRVPILLRTRVHDNRGCDYGGSWALLPCIPQPSVRTYLGTFLTLEEQV